MITEREGASIGGHRSAIGERRNLDLPYRHFVTSRHPANMFLIAPYHAKWSSQNKRKERMRDWSGKHWAVSRGRKQIVESVSLLPS